MKFIYLRVAFTSEDREDMELECRIAGASAVMRALYRSVVMKKELGRNAKLSIFNSISVPILTFGHESWVVTERM